MGELGFWDFLGLSGTNWDFLRPSLSQFAQFYSALTALTSSLLRLATSSSSLLLTGS